MNIFKIKYLEHEFDCADDEYILDAAENAGIDIPYSCRVGTCDACTCYLTKGEVNQRDGSYLDEELQREGYFSACVAYPLKDCQIYHVTNLDNFPIRGKWVVIDVDYDGIKNSAFLIAQGLAHIEEGKFIFSDPRAYVGTTRTVTLRWEPFEIFDMEYDDSERHPLGKIKTVRQKYIYGSDELAGGFSYYWYPHAGGGF